MDKALQAARDEHEAGFAKSARFWWQQSSFFWDLPFFSEFGWMAPVDFENACAAREQLFAQRELLDEGDLAPDSL